MPRVAVICDLLDEGWHSMDLVADMLLEQFASLSAEIEAVRMRPVLPPALSRLPFLRGKRFARNADRLLNRTVRYPLFLRRNAGQADLFHIVDHSYAHLIRRLRPDRTVITCHDLDAFRCLIDPQADPRPAWFRSFANYILGGLKQAAHVVCVSETVREEALRSGILQTGQSSVVYNGVHPSCDAQPKPAFDRRAAELLPFPPEVPLLLHVGSTIPRKSIDVLLRVFSQARNHLPLARLVRVGGPLTAEQSQLAHSLNLQNGIVEMPFLDREVLAAIYRRCDLLLLPSRGEGFGLPLAEAMACGCPVLANDLPVLKEVGGSAAEFVSISNERAWSDAVLTLLTERLDQPDRWARRQALSIARASRFTWQNTAQGVLAVYRQLV